MKKWMSLFCALVLVFGLAACQKEEEPDSSGSSSEAGSSSVSQEVEQGSSSQLADSSSSTADPAPQSSSESGSSSAIDLRQQTLDKLAAATWVQKDWESTCLYVQDDDLYFWAARDGGLGGKVTGMRFQESSVTFSGKNAWSRQYNPDNMTVSVDCSRIDDGVVTVTRFVDGEVYLDPVELIKK